ncbi:low affinity immunoglobulin gamma Fc region receptor III-A-like isoform X2 [Mirounga angustirostris]|uniref:low affinity immunoglobulin gamma Fc region receptor III-A isoform X2 n=1 Tax=Mirounga leonina TaxID=9715 RepID=UPI00156C0F33|nr:low affinity immunoglobulin gamma Fc region receptor III-A isoform X2 [Mirounga leonina]XP_045732731.1 low affinity immunoglobulin gamma Fc region receptor III-A-like isoform X2 [Mirounga angustirostris]
MRRLLPSMALLLLVSAGTQAANLTKAVVVLEPPYNRVLTLDSVTFKCQGTDPFGDSSTQWLHNGTLISDQTSYFIKVARIEDSGEYRCRKGLSELSDPVQLEVHVDKKSWCDMSSPEGPVGFFPKQALQGWLPGWLSMAPQDLGGECPLPKVLALIAEAPGPWPPCLSGWLLLRTPRQVFQEGEPIWLRCHSWKNKPVWKVQYFQNGKSKKFSYNNSDFHIPAATSKHSGSYFCRGLIGKRNESSEPVDIIIQGSAVPSTLPLLHWPQIPFSLVMVLLFAVDTGLYFAVQRDLHSSMRGWKNSKVSWKQGP